MLKDSPGALPGGCTRDLVHRFYQEQYQLNGGRQNRYVTGSDAVGLTMGHYDTRSLPIYDYLHGKGAPHYVLADHFFQARVRRLVPQPPVPDRRTGAARHRPAGGAGGRDELGARRATGCPPATRCTRATGTVVDGQLTQACADRRAADYAQACGDFAVNTVQPSSPPFGTGAEDPADRRHEVPEHR